MSLIFVFLTKNACIRSDNHLLIAELIFSFMHLESITGRTETMIQKKERGVAHFVLRINVRVLQARFQEPIMLHWFWKIAPSFPVAIFVTEQAQLLDNHVRIGNIDFLVHDWARQQTLREALMHIHLRGRVWSDDFNDVLLIDDLVRDNYDLTA